jgi:hypothetical protein
MSKEHIAFSSSGHFPPIEVVKIECTVENIVDRDWLFNHIPWLNHDNKTAHLTLDKVSTIYYYDSVGQKVKTITFDNVGVSAGHGFAGNSYSFSFQLGDKDKFGYAPEPDFMSLAEDEVIQKVINNTIYKLDVNKKERIKLLTILSNLKQEDE